jgi:hypothetical protein
MQLNQLIMLNNKKKSDYRFFFNLLQWTCSKKNYCNEFQLVANKYSHIFNTDIILFVKREKKLTK